MSVFKDTVFKATVFLVDAVSEIISDVIDTHDGGPARRKRSSSRPKKERKDREDLLKELKLAFGLLDETPEKIEQAEVIAQKVKKFIPSAIAVNLSPVISELAKLERALNIYRAEQREREMEEEIILMLV